MIQIKTVSIGRWVEIQDGDQREAWQIVEPHDADATTRCISAGSPLARAVLGHQAGDRVRVETPGGRRMVTILDVR